MYAAKSASGLGEAAFGHAQALRERPHDLDCCPEDTADHPHDPCDQPNQMADRASDADGLARRPQDLTNDSLDRPLEPRGRTI